MKKLFAIALIATALVSCNEEAKTEETTTTPTEVTAPVADSVVAPMADSVMAPVMDSVAK